MSGAVFILPPYAFMPWTGTFFFIFHMRATYRVHHVVVLMFLCSVKLPRFKFLPAAPSPVHTFSRHTALLPRPPLSASPTHHASFVYRENNGEGHFYVPHLASLTVLYLGLSYPHPRSPYARQEIIYGIGGMAPHILKVGTRWMRVLSQPFRKHSPQPGRHLVGDLFPVTDFEPWTVRPVAQSC